MYGELLARLGQRVSTCTTEWSYLGFTNWVPAVDVDLVKAVVIARAVKATNSSNLTLRFVYQTAATRTDKPDAWALLGSDMTVSEGNELVQCTGEITTVNVAEKFFVRFGIAYHAASGEDASASVSLHVSYDAPGQTLGKKTFQARVNSADDRHEPISPWFPVLRATNFKFAVIVSALEGTGFRWRPTYQLAQKEPESAETWISDWGQDWVTTGKAETVVGSLQTSGTGTSMWMRLGIQYSRSSSGFAEASVSVAAMGWR